MKNTAFPEAGPVNMLKVSSNITSAGLSFIVNGIEYPIDYPEGVWDKVPESLKPVLRDNLALAVSMHLPLILDVDGIEFESGRPFLEPYLFQNFIFDVPSCTEVDGLDTSETMRKFMLKKYEYAKEDVAFPLIESRMTLNLPGRAIVAMSYGKDSLLTYGIADEIGLDPEIVYIVEAALIYEQKHKIELGRKFEKEFGKKLHILTHQTGKLRDGERLGVGRTEFGWGLQNTEYAIELLPFALALNGEYILFGNEQSTSESYLDTGGKWRVYPCYDQSHLWSVHVDQITQRLSGGIVRTASLIEPLLDMMIQRILIRRYPQFAKYQMSCFTETDAGKNYRWCQDCGVCGKMYLITVASGMDPRKIGFTRNMLDKSHKHLFTIFGGKSKLTYANSGLGREEQLLAFFLSAQRGFAGGLVEDFRTSPLFTEAQERQEDLISKFTGIYEPISLPNALKDSVISIYKEELALIDF